MTIADVKLTALASCAGCAAKIGPGTLAEVLRPIRQQFDPVDYPALLVGLAEPDDAAVYKLNEEQAVISTTDFFPPVVDDPYSFGAIAAANALSDVYAMGGEPLFAINLVTYPDTLDLAILTEILRGGGDRVKAAGAVIVGGHTVIDNEPKYGLAVTGVVHPQRIFTKGGAQPGDVLIMTKPLGTGVITTALKREQADPAHVQAAIESMMRLNQSAARAAAALGKPHIHAVTDITGYSLIGHAHEMAHLSAADFTFAFDALPWLPGAQGYAQLGTFPGGTTRNAEYFRQWTHFAPTISEEAQMLCFDPQTSGGLLIAVAEAYADGLIESIKRNGASAWKIGSAVAGSGRIIVQ